MGYVKDTADIIRLIVQGSANVESIIRANSLDQMTAPAANLSMNTHRLTSLSPAIISTDAPTVGQLVGTGQPYIVSGCVWTADSPGSTRACSMTSGTVMIGGILLTVASVTSRTFTASNDTYVDFQDNGDGTATITYTAVANYTASPALANSGTALNTIRNAVISASASAVAANGIGQGAIGYGFNANTPVNAGTQGSTTVAAGSTGHAITATPLLVAAVTNFASAAGYALWTSAATGEQALLAYTGTTAGSINGITVVAGRAAATVTTGDTVSAAWPIQASDTIGNRIYPTQPYGIIASCGWNDVITTTATNNGVFLIGRAAHAEQVAVMGIVVPAGPSRRVKVFAQFPTLQSSAAAGTQLDLNVGSATSGGGLGSWATASPKVKVVSDGDAEMLVGFSPYLAPGSYYISASVNAGASGTLTLGRALTQTILAAEFC